MKKDHGTLLRWMESIVGILIQVSLGKRIEGTRANRLDIYISSWAAFEIIILIVLAFVNIGAPVEIILFILLSYHLFEIAVATFNSVIITPLEGKKHSSVPRLFSLILVNYFEIILIFAIMYNFLMDHESVLKSLNLSVSLATLAGANPDKESNPIFIATIAEMLLGIFFIGGAIATVSNYIGNKE
jgi:hypothetical protein